MRSVRKDVKMLLEKREVEKALLLFFLTYPYQRPASETFAGDEEAVAYLMLLKRPKNPNLHILLYSMREVAQC